MMDHIPYLMHTMTLYYFIESQGLNDVVGGNYYYQDGPFMLVFSPGCVFYQLRCEREAIICSVRITFDDASNTPPQASGLQEHRSNFVIGINEDRWVTDINRYDSVRYNDLWEGIDLQYRLTGSGLKYEFILHPHSDPDDIKVHVSGHEGLSTDGDGILSIVTSVGSIMDGPLEVYYEDDEATIIPSRFEMLGPDGYGVVLGQYDVERTVIIDPVIYATFLGGGDWDASNGVFCGPDGSAYVFGDTSSHDLPTTSNSYQQEFGGGNFDATLYKLSPDGTHLEFASYFGGSGDDSTLRGCLDVDGNIWLVGSTSSDDLPVTVDAVQGSYGGGTRDVFLCKISADGSELLYSTYLGGSKADKGGDIALDINGAPCIVGQTFSDDFPVTPDALQKTYSGGRKVIVLFLVHRRKHNG